jgi:hypothetical protein
MADMEYEGNGLDPLLISEWDWGHRFLLGDKCLGCQCGFECIVSVSMFWTGHWFSQPYLDNGDWTWRGRISVSLSLCGEPESAEPVYLDEGGADVCVAISTPHVAEEQVWALEIASGLPEIWGLLLLSYLQKLVTSCWLKDESHHDWHSDGGIDRGRHCDHSHYNGHTQSWICSTDEDAQIFGILSTT